MVSAQNVSKVYTLYARPSDRLRSFLPLGEPAGRAFWALRNVTFGVERGEVLGLVGPNGSGKSTVLQIVAGIVQPTLGRVVCSGRIAALLELGAGFNPEFSGRENVYLNGEIMGLSRRELNRAFSSIEEFAGVGPFIDRPVKEYSTGMYVRLAFATAIHVEPDILIVDEALAVGDASFAAKCIRRFAELKARGVTVLFVSHDLGLVKHLSDRAIFLLNGEIVAEGAPNDVANRYVAYVQSSDVPTEDPGFAQASLRHGDQTSRIASVDLLDDEGRSTRAIVSGQPVTIRILVEFSRNCVNPVVGVLIRNRIGADVYGTNTRIEQFELGLAEPGDQIQVEFQFPCSLTRQTYTLTVAVQNEDGTSHDWLDDALQFTVMDTKDLAGLINLNATISAHRLPPGTLR